MYIPELGAQISLVEVKQVLKIIKAGKAAMKSWLRPHDVRALGAPQLGLAEREMPGRVEQRSDHAAVRGWGRAGPARLQRHNAAEWWARSSCGY